MGKADVLTAPIFIVGSGRSGTTLLRSLLSDHPDVAMLPRESHFFNAFAGRYLGVDLGSPAAFETCWKDFVEREQFARLGVDPTVLRTEIDQLEHVDLEGIFTSLLLVHARSQGKARAGEKTPSHFRYIRTMLDWYPDAQILFLLRDPRGVLASYLKVDQRWAKLDADTILSAWRDSVYEIRRWNDSPSVRVVRYEHLVTEPEIALHEILDWLLLSYPSDFLDREARGGHKTGAYHQDGEVRAGSIERWQQVLTPAQVQHTEIVLGAEMRRFGYPCVSRAVGTKERVSSEVRFRTYRARRGMGSVRDRARSLRVTRLLSEGRRT